MNLLSIEAMQAIVGTELARTIILSRLTREARRQHGLDGARALLQTLMPLFPESSGSVVGVVPNASFRLGRDEAYVWDAAGRLISAMCATMGEEYAFLILLGKMKATKQMIQGFIDSMQAAARYDISNW